MDANRRTKNRGGLGTRLTMFSVYDMCQPIALYIVCVVSSTIAPFHVLFGYTHAQLVSSTLCLLLTGLTYLFTPAELQCSHSRVWEPGNEASFISTRPINSVFFFFVFFFLSCSTDLETFYYMSDIGLNRVPRGLCLQFLIAHYISCILQVIKNYWKYIEKGWKRG